VAPPAPHEWWYLPERLTLGTRSADLVRRVACRWYLPERLTLGTWSCTCSISSGPAWWYLPERLTLGRRRANYADVASVVVLARAVDARDWRLRMTSSTARWWYLPERLTLGTEARIRLRGHLPERLTLGTGCRRSCSLGCGVMTLARAVDVRDLDTRGGDAMLAGVVVLARAVDVPGRSRTATGPRKR
jgi:hypothetical protein